MSKRTGRIATLEVDDGGGFVAVGNIMDGTFDETDNQLDSTDRDDAGFDSQLYGHYHGTGNITLMYNEADVGQEAIRDAIEGKTTLIVRIRTHGTEALARQTTGTATFESKSTDKPLRDVTKQTIVFHMSGAPTFDTQ